ncbi:MAG: serine/threonine protein kinase [Proteobacteria bacterium]|nr:serine/threonine protein kinase [Pseudomonadota bacterium]
MLQPGSRLGPYQIVAPLARGGTAQIFLAQLPGAQGEPRTVVLKVLLPHLAQDPAFVRHFGATAVLASRLDHPNLTRVTDFGEADGRCFMVMDHVVGRDLRQILEALRRRRETMPIWVALRIVGAVCRGLHHAHELRDEAGVRLGLVHGDVSPDNVVVSYAGAIKLIDFGLGHAEPWVDAPGSSGLPLGKQRYMAPEQMFRLSIDRRADVYAAGAVLYACLTGFPPYGGANGATLRRQVLRGAPVPVRLINREVSPRLEAVVLRTLARDPGARHGDARSLSAELEEILGAGEDAERGLGFYVESLCVEEEEAEGRSGRPVAPLSAGPLRAARAAPGSRALRGPRGGREVPLVAGSPGARDAAAEHFVTGLELVRRRAYAEALVEWERALALVPDDRIYRLNVDRLCCKLRALAQATPD